MAKAAGISVVMTVFNEGDWPNKSLRALDDATERSGFTVEAVVIDDGSTDQTAQVVRAFEPQSKRLKIKFIQNKSNLGRYLGRKAGVKAASHEYLMFLDARVIIDKDSLVFLEKKLRNNPNQVWNAHVNVAKKGNIFARFWDAIVCITWRRYFGNPRETSYGPEEFDYFPKGTTCFYVSKQLFKDAMDLIDSQSKGDQKFTNDDTALIRYIVSQQRINIAPKFSCVYNGRSTMNKFLAHAYHRGQVFTDGFLHPGNRFFVPLLGFLLFSAAAMAVLLLLPGMVVQVIGVGVLAVVLLLFLGALLFRLDWRDALSLAVLSPFFIAVYGAGIWRGVFRKLPLPEWALRQRHFLGGNIIEYVLVFLAFTLLTFIYTDWVVLHVTHRLFIDGVGDGTSGFLWLNFADNDLNPLPGFTNMVNYPVGVNLANPTYITYAALWAPLWILSHILSPVVALNLVTFWGLLSGGFAMYWLVKRLTRSVPLSFFAGFAVAFVPYHVIKSSSHLAYIFSIVFVLILAGFIGLWRRQTWQRAALLALALALSFYTDGYYLLIGSVFFGALLFAGVIHSWFAERKDFVRILLKRARYLILAGGILLVLCGPLLYITLHSGNEVKSDLGASRGDIFFEITHYSAVPIDFVLPPVSNSFLQNFPKFNELQAAKNSRSNPSESSLYIGYAILIPALLGVTAMIAYWLKRSGQTLHGLEPVDRKLFLFIGCLFLVSVPILLSFTVRPQIPAGGHIIYMPAEVLLKLHLTLWRVLARFFLPMHVMLSLFAALTIWVFFKAAGLGKRNGWQGMIIAVLLVFVAFEYANTSNRPPFDFHNMPPGYVWLSKQQDVQAVVEIPFMSKPWDPASYAVTAQMVHRKKLINLHLPQQAIGAHNAFVSLTNPETADYIASRGAQMAITHDAQCTLNEPWVSLAYDGSKDHGYSPLCIYRVQAATNDHLFVNLKSGFADIAFVTKDGYYDEVYGNYGEMWVMNQYDEFVTKPTTARISLTLFGTHDHDPFTGTWRILQNEQPLATGQIENSLPVTATAVVDASKPIQLRFTRADGTDPDLYQIGFTNTVITAQ